MKTNGEKPNLPVKSTSKGIQKRHVRVVNTRHGKKPVLVNRFMPIKETQSNKDLRLRRGYNVLVNINAKKFKEEFEKDWHEPLERDPNRKEFVSKLKRFDEYPQVDYGSKLDVSDGRHRIARAAELGRNIVVAVQSRDIIGKLKARDITVEKLDPTELSTDKWECKIINENGKEQIIWTSKVNDDLSIEVVKLSMKFEPGTQIYITAGPDYDKHFGWFVMFRKLGEWFSPIKADVNTTRRISYEQAAEEGIQVPPDKNKYLWAHYPPGYRGPWEKEHAIELAKHTIQDPRFNEKYNKPKDYTLDIPGWELEHNIPNLAYRWYYKKNGRHIIFIENDWEGNWSVSYYIGYDDDPPEAKKKFDKIATLRGLSAAVHYVQDYVQKLNIPEGALEKGLAKLLSPEFAAGLKAIPPGKLDALTKLVKEGTIPVDTAVDMIKKGEFKDGEKKQDIPDKLEENVTARTPESVLQTFIREAKSIWNSDILDRIEFVITLRTDKKKALMSLGYNSRPASFNGRLYSAPKRMNLYIQEEVLTMPEKKYLELLRHEALHVGISGHNREFITMAERLGIPITLSAQGGEKYQVQTKNENQSRFVTVATFDKYDDAKKEAERITTENRQKNIRDRVRIRM